MLQSCPGGLAQRRSGCCLLPSALSPGSRLLTTGTQPVLSPLTSQWAVHASAVASAASNGPLAAAPQAKEGAFSRLMSNIGLGGRSEASPEAVAPVVRHTVCSSWCRNHRLQSAAQGCLSGKPCRRRLPAHSKGACGLLAGPQHHTPFRNADAAAASNRCRRQDKVGQAS